MHLGGSGGGMSRQLSSWRLQVWRQVELRRGERVMLLLHVCYGRWRRRRIEQVCVASSDQVCLHWRSGPGRPAEQKDWKL